MKRTRKIAAAPERSAGETWGVIADLITDTLTRSDAIDESDIGKALGAAGGIGRMLIGGGHLTKSPITLVADSVHLEITTISGNAAVGMSENLAAVPGAAAAEDWTLYLPSPDPLKDAVAAIAEAHPCLSVGEAPAPAVKTEASHERPLNVDALKEWGKSG